MQKSFHVAEVVLLLSLLPQLFSSEQIVLSRQVGAIETADSSASVITVVLAQTHTPGGIISIYEQCSSPTTQLFKIRASTLKDTLDSIKQIDPSKDWEYQDGDIILGSRSRSRTILSTKLRQITIDPEETATLQTQRLLALPEIEKEIGKAGLTVETPSLGLSAVRIGAGVNSAPASKREPIILKSLTLLDALNQIGKRNNGQGVWHYQETHCGSHSSVRIDWVVAPN